MDAVVAVWSLGQRQVSLAHVFALPQRHVAHQQQPCTIACVPLSVLQAGSAGGGGAGDFAHDTKITKRACFRTSRWDKFIVRVILTTHEPESIAEVDSTAQVPGVCSLHSIILYSNMGQQQTTDGGAAESHVTLESLKYGCNIFFCVQMALTAVQPEREKQL